jgi:two-component system, response regulator PdtaR
MAPCIKSGSRTRGAASATSSQRSIAPRRRVLIVEDDALLAIDIEDALREAGYDVVGVAERCSRAVDLAGCRRPDVVVMDVRLAGKRDGIETAVIIRQSYDIPSIFATGQPESELGNRADAARPCGWLKKPYQRHQLVEAVSKAFC